MKTAEKNTIKLNKNSENFYFEGHTDQVHTSKTIKKELFPKLADMY
jgi:hypothetical protein